MLVLLMFRSVFGCFLFLGVIGDNDCRKAHRESLGVRRDRKRMGLVIQIWSHFK